MVSYARATRGLRRPSLNARSGSSISPHPQRDNEQAWRDRLKVLVRCAQSRIDQATLWRDGQRRSEEGDWSSQTALFARRARNKNVLARCAQQGQPRHSPRERWGESEGPRLGSWHVMGERSRCGNRRSFCATMGQFFQVAGLAGPGEEQIYRPSFRSSPRSQSCR